MTCTFTHVGSRKTKSEARGRLWWPGLSVKIDKCVASGGMCAALRPAAPPRALLTPWPFPPQPWHRMHMNFLWPISSKVYLIIVDAHYQWMECYDVSSCYGAGIVINKLCDVISRFGLIHTICTDNGTSFVSAKFKNFVTVLESISSQPEQQRASESLVKIVKEAIKSIILSGNSIKNDRVSKM